MSNKGEERKNIYVVVENFSFRKVFRYRWFLLIMFFIFVGIASFFLLSNEAQRLAGSKRYSQLILDSGRVNSFSFIEKLRYVINSITSGSNKELLTRKEANLVEEKNQQDYEDESGSANLKSNVSAVNNKSFVEKNNNSSSQGLLNDRSEVRKNVLESNLSSLSSLASGGISKTSLSNFNLSTNPNIKIKTNDAKIGISHGKKSEGDKSAMGLLKSTFKTTLMAARDASNDTARAWTSKAFDYSVEANKTIEYDEKVRASLDRINPNSIPAFLKDPSLEPESMKSLKVADVPGLSSEDEKKNSFDLDVDAIKSQIQDYKDKKHNLLSNLANINPLFNIQGNQYLSDEDIDKKSASVNLSNTNASTKLDGIITQPSGVPQLFAEVTNVVTDEYGYIRVTHSDGSIRIFDSNSGKILGCEVPSIGMCLLPGAYNCPQDLIWNK